MGDWAAAHLDVSRQTATRLTQLAHHSDPEVETAMAEGRWGLDRAAALTKLRSATSLLQSTLPWIWVSPAIQP